MKALEGFRRESNTGVEVAEYWRGVMVLVRVYGTAYVDRTGKAVFDKPPLRPKNNSLLIHCDFERLVTQSDCTFPEIHQIMCIANPPACVT